MGSAHKLNRSATYNPAVVSTHRHRHGTIHHGHSAKSGDLFEANAAQGKKFRKHHIHDAEEIRYRDVFKNAKKQFGKPIKENHKVPWPIWETIATEEQLVKKPTLESFLTIESEFKQTKFIAGHQKYRWLNDIMINPAEDYPQINGKSKYFEMERWHYKHQESFDKHYKKSQEKTEHRHQKIEEKGPGFGGKMTHKIAKSKAAAFYAKNNLTIRGNVFKLTHEACPKNIIEMMPRFGYRKGAHVGVRIGQFALNGVLAGIGYAMAPVTFGLSKIVTNSISTVVTLSGESITHKIEGAERRKISVHAGLRGFQLEIPLCVPVAGTLLYSADTMALGVAAVGIVSTTVADAILRQMSDRYASTMNADDLGNSRCLEELNARIDYLSKFFLPYGQYLLLKETDPDNRVKLKAILKKRFKTLRNLEKKKVESLNFYRLALAAEKVPKDMVEKIAIDVKNALPDTRVNTHKIVKRCLAALIQRDGGMEQFLRMKEKTNKEA